jgi:hypothetical protein
MPTASNATTSPMQQAEHSDRGWIAANVGRIKYDSLRILGLREKEQQKEK